MGKSGQNAQKLVELESLGRVGVPLETAVVHRSFDTHQGRREKTVECRPSEDDEEWEAMERLQESWPESE